MYARKLRVGPVRSGPEILAGLRKSFAEVLHGRPKRHKTAFTACEAVWREDSSQLHRHSAVMA